MVQNTGGSKLVHAYHSINTSAPAPFYEHCMQHGGRVAGLQAAQTFSPTLTNCGIQSKGPSITSLWY